MAIPDRALTVCARSVVIILPGFLPSSRSAAPGQGNTNIFRGRTQSPESDGPPAVARYQDIVFEERLRGHVLTFHSTWGLFNPKGIDEGSRLLIDQVQVETDHLGLDLGCGYGPIGLTLARICSRGQIHLVDKDFVAVEYARKNAALNHIHNCQVYLSNAFSHVPDLCFDTIVSNLPAKAGNEMLSIIMHEAHRHLKSGGRFYVVTISGLKEYIKRNFREIFGNYEKVKQSKTYTVSLAIRE
jgi:16S rRNA (guanine1207-N2)-methyltransferase